MNPPEFDVEAYELAQQGLACVKAAIVRVLAQFPEGLRGAEIGRRLGVNCDFLGQ